MNVKSEIILPATASPASGTKAPGAAGKPPVASEAVNEGKHAEVAAVQEVLRGALDVEPVADRKLEISFENELNVFVVKVLDQESGEVIRQIPMPEAISIAKGLRAAIRRMANDQSGIAVDQEV